uniref:NBS-LRR disease resistance protein n=1 Tax=Dasypyrum villosum TaxID=40247 RepID=A0A8K1IB56_9POAL|nr:NBS-LRR disease resistance protein [Dasypyrum villosum]
MAVVSAAHGAFGPLLGKLTALLADECGRLKGVRREVRSLRSELASMHAALKEYTKLEHPNEQVKAWISLVRELAYDTEDVFDKFIHHLGDTRDHDDGGFKEFFRKTVRRLKTLGARRGIAGEIHDLKNRIRQVKELKDCYKLNDAPSTSTGPAALDPRLHALFADEAHLVGVEDPRDDLVKWTVEDGNKHCKALSIVGFGGLGKTTLANQVYREIQAKFDSHAFVSVSQKPDIRKIIKDLISQVSFEDGSTKDTSGWDERKCIAKLRDLLQDRRYLVIIDDLWSTQVWNTIKCAFPENDCCSRIITTTRIVDVANSCCLGTDDRVYAMEPLSDVNSRRLFFKRIFGSDGCCPDMLKEVSNEILKKCGGLPLAIISMSSLLANRPAMKEEWEKVKRSIGSALENNQSLDGMNSILSLSYNDLPPNLKTCLLYLSLFPEDYEIERERLVRRWIAEGFILEQREQSQQEVAEDYFYQLINKSMVQPVDIGYDGKARACRVHDMVLEIIISKAVEENFVTVVGRGQTSLKSQHGFIRRLSIQNIDQDMASTLANEDLSHVRSLTVTSSGCMKHVPSLNEFEALRVLDFEGIQDLEGYDMSNIDKLFHLKYLSFRDTNMWKVPPRVVLLYDLEVLDLRGIYIQDLPAGIVCLSKIQYLPTQTFCEVPHGISNMRNLRVAPNFDITKSSLDALEELGSLTRLNELGFSLDSGHMKRSYQEMLLSSLCKLGSCKLQSVCIFHSSVWDHDGSINFLDSWSPPPSSLQSFLLDGVIYFASVPKWISPALTSLSSLQMNLVELREEGLHTLGELPSLVVLYLSLRKGPRKKLAIIGFPSLKKFGLCGKEGAYITFMKGSMAKLEDLTLSYDVSLERVSYAIRSKSAVAVIENEAAAHPNHPEVDTGLLLWGPDKDQSDETGNDEEKYKEEGN